MRGKVFADVVPTWFARITPAYAGKSFLVIFKPGKEKDHPRVCGEKCMAFCKNCAVLGSPPRMRGKELRVKRCFADDGITPAYAGKSYVFVSEKLVPEDHPRVCGEKIVENASFVRCWGSPPRMRGKVHLTGAVVVGGGITPAYAGKRTA